VVRQDFAKFPEAEAAVSVRGSLCAVVAPQSALSRLVERGLVLGDTLEMRDPDDRAVLLFRGRPSRVPRADGLELLRAPQFVAVCGPVNGERLADLPGWLADERKPDSDEPDWNAIEAKADPNKIVSLTFGELDDIEFPPRELIVEPWLGKDEQSMVVGPKSRGKSFVTDGIAAIAATGGRLWRWRAPKPLRVLLIDGEMGGRRTQGRIRLIRDTCGLDRDALRKNLHIVTPDLQPGDLFNLAQPAGRAAVERHVAEIGGVDLLVLDNVSVLYRGRDLNTEEGWFDWQEWLLRWRRRAVATFTALHVGKDEQRGGRSHSKYRDVLDSEIQIGTPAHVVANGLHFSMKFTAVRDFGHDMGPVEIQLKEGEWIVSLAKPDGAPRDRREKLLAAVTAEPGISESKLLGKVGGNEDEALQVRNVLEEAGEIRVERGGRGRPTKHYPAAT